MTLLSKSKYDAIIVRFFRGRKMTSSSNKAASIYEGTNVNAGGFFENVEETKLFDQFKLELGLFVIV